MTLAIRVPPPACPVVRANSPGKTLPDKPVVTHFFPCLPLSRPADKDPPTRPQYGMGQKGVRYRCRDGRAPTEGWSGASHNGT